MPDTVTCQWQKGREFQITGPVYWKDLTPHPPPPWVLLPIQGTWKIWVPEAEQREWEGKQRVVFHIPLHVACFLQVLQTGSAFEAMMTPDFCYYIIYNWFRSGPDCN